MTCESGTLQIVVGYFTSTLDLVMILCQRDAKQKHDPEFGSHLHPAFPSNENE